MVSDKRLNVLLSALLLCSAGCATQKSVDDLSARLTKLETRLAKAEDKKSSDKAALQRALDSADSQRLTCGVIAKENFNTWLQNNGKPAKGRPGSYSTSLEGGNSALATEERAEANCQKEYEDALELAKLKFSE